VLEFAEYVGEYQVIILPGLAVGFAGSDGCGLSCLVPLDMQESDFRQRQDSPAGAVLDTHLLCWLISPGTESQGLSPAAAVRRHAGGSDYYHFLPYQSDPPTAIERDRFSKRQSLNSRLAKLPRFDVRLGKLEYHGNSR